MPAIDLELCRVFARPEYRCERPTQGHVCKQRWGLSLSAWPALSLFGWLQHLCESSSAG